MKPTGTEISSNSTHCDMDSVGAWLKSIREERGESLDEVSKVTRIGRTYLEAIEEGAASKLPSLAYTRGFIRLYAAHLGQSPEEALSMLNGKQPAPVVVDSPPPLQQQFERTPPPPYRRRLIFFSALTLVLVSGYLFLKPKSSHPPEQPTRREPAPIYQAEKTAPAIQQPAVPKNDPLPSVKTELPNSVSSHSEGFVLRLKAVSDGKVHIMIDGSVSQEYDLVAGDLVEWKAESAIALDLDNAASVEGELDGKPLKPFGTAGKAAHLVLKADGKHQE